jgi:hypothetical protein
MNFIPLHVQFQVIDGKEETEATVSLHALDNPIDKFFVIYRHGAFR